MNATNPMTTKNEPAMDVPRIRDSFSGIISSVLVVFDVVLRCVVLLIISTVVWVLVGVLIGVLRCDIVALNSSERNNREEK